MQQISCADVRAAFALVVRSGQPLPNTTIYAAHVATCSLCRGSLMLLASEVFSTPPQPISHDECRRQLPAVIDAELDQPGMVLHRFQDVYWHLWTCPDCSDMYVLTYGLAAAEQQTPFIIPQTPAAPAFTEVVMHLTRSLLNVLLPSVDPSWGMARSHDISDNVSGDVIMQQTTRTDHKLELSVVHQSDQSWQIVVQSMPPVQGTLILGLGAATFSASFATDGTATIDDVPAILFADPAGPDLIVALDTP